jgi:hypothetical protein
VGSLWACWIRYRRMSKDGLMKVPIVINWLASLIGNARGGRAFKVM